MGTKTTKQLVALINHHNDKAWENINEARRLIIAYRESNMFAPGPPLSKPVDELNNEDLPIFLIKQAS